MWLRLEGGLQLPAIVDGHILEDRTVVKIVTGQPAFLEDAALLIQFLGDVPRTRAARPGRQERQETQILRCHSREGKFVANEAGASLGSPGELRPVAGN